jgi:hypothetical protein
VPKFWITYTNAARSRHTPFKPDHSVPANEYELNGDWLTFTSDSTDGVRQQVLAVRNQDVARIEWIEDWQAAQRKTVESEAYRRGLGVSDEFDDLFLSSTYAEDEPIRIFIPGDRDRRVPDFIPKDRDGWVPERLWGRLVALGLAYQLHLLPLLAATTEPQFLNAEQVSTLDDELQFLTRVARDELLAAVVDQVRTVLLNAQQRSTEDDALGIEGP